ncbi:hypothetical protein BHC44_02280 [Snodgrassella alvi]|jgi:hypothetical protein|uniref:Uncharacterized protein n=1 Tax=Snodgrassella alvi TaxID=1196083 RepID=A0A2N9XVH1_9NEIS|nr:hypothetical protein BHC49_10360 [Snodgrassella alvi]PIT55780.1 hypothetical protein BHC44_02280 [Snodgrassella alvi]
MLWVLLLGCFDIRGLLLLLFIGLMSFCLAAVVSFCFYDVCCNATGKVLLVAFFMWIDGLACTEAGEHGFEGFEEYEYVE